MKAAKTSSNRKSNIADQIRDAEEAVIAACGKDYLQELYSRDADLGWRLLAALNREIGRIEGVLAGARVRDLEVEGYSHNEFRGIGRTLRAMQRKLLCQTSQ